jgi:hypothetical protein
LQRWLGALTGSSRVSEEDFPQGRACFEEGRSFPMRYLFGCVHRGFAIVLATVAWAFSNLFQLRVVKRRAATYGVGYVSWEKKLF